jgi:hypothetical protein
MSWLITIKPHKQLLLRSLNPVLWQGLFLKGKNKMNLLNKDFADRSWVLYNARTEARKHNRLLVIATALTYLLFKLVG